MVQEGTFLIEVSPWYEFRTNNEEFTDSKTIIQGERITQPKTKTGMWSPKNETIEVKQK